MRMKPALNNERRMNDMKTKTWNNDNESYIKHKVTITNTKYQ